GAPHPARAHGAACVVHLLVMRPTGERAGHGRDPHPAPLAGPTWCLALAHDHDLVLEGVAPLLPRVEPPLPPGGPGNGPLGGVEEKLADLVGLQFDAALGDP